ncbi:MAG: lipoyl(octanoyl) transferase LipB [Chitinophagales bacterium]|nr:lipoyl(octanoyl) transferase LipB [Chitinophagales bacterium]
MREVEIIDLGICDYKKTFEFQERLFNQIVEKKRTEESYTHGRNYLLLVEHPSIYTLGKNGDISHIVFNNENIEVLRVGRGGDVTYHGPGQLVVYPIFDLGQFGKSIKNYIHLLEEVIIQVLAHYRIKGERSEGETGVWIEPSLNDKARKICAIGVRTSRWVTMHGLALNVNTDLSYFEKIIPCGIYNKDVTSIKKEVAKEVLFEEAKALIIKSFEEIFQLELMESQRLKL